MEQQSNMLVTALMGRRRELAAVLREYGEFKPTGYRGVMLGHVPAVDPFLQSVQELIAQGHAVKGMLARVIPFDKTFHFAGPDDLLDRLFEAVTDYVPRVAGRRFYVRMERRGFKGKIMTPEVERAVDRYMQQAVGTTGDAATVDYDDPDEIIVIETVTKFVGVACLGRALREAYRFVRVE